MRGPAVPRFGMVIRIVCVVTGLLAALAGSSALAATSTAAGDVALTMTGPDSGVVGQSLAISATATNTTTSPIASVSVDVFYPSSAKLVKVTTGAGACTKLAGGGSGNFSDILICSVGTLQPGAAVTASLTLQPGVAGTMTIAGSTSWDIGGGIFTGNSTSLATPIAPAPTDVQISGSASTGSPTAGSAFFYTFQVKDGGSQPAYGVTFTDTLPAAATLVGASTSNGSPCTVSSGTVNCGLGDISVGATVVVTVNAVAPTTPGTYTDTATAADTNGDTQPSNNSVNVTIQVK